MIGRTISCQLSCQLAKSTEQVKLNRSAQRRKLNRQDAKSAKGVIFYDLHLIFAVFASLRFICPRASWYPNVVRD